MLFNLLVSRPPPGRYAGAGQYTLAHGLVHIPVGLANVSANILLYCN